MFIDRELHRLFPIDCIDMIIYMRAEPATSFLRMRRRDRPEERSVGKVLAHAFKNYMTIVRAVKWPMCFTYIVTCSLFHLAFH